MALMLFSPQKFEFSHVGISGCR